MNEHPILFSAPMVKALLAGEKTQTRRIVKPQPSGEWYPTVGRYCPTVIDRHGDEQPGAEIFGAADDSEGRRFPYGAVGSRLWVRETWKQCQCCNALAFAADGQHMRHGPECVTPDPKRWRPSIFMPRAASRITLEVTGVRVERVQEISEADALAEGVKVPGQPMMYRSFDDAEAGKPMHPFNARYVFEGLWDCINSKRAPWASNPWVWVVEFKRITP